MFIHGYALVAAMLLIGASFARPPMTESEACARLQERISARQAQVVTTRPASTQPAAGEDVLELDALRREVARLRREVKDLLAENGRLREELRTAKTNLLPDARYDTVTGDYPGGGSVRVKGHYRKDGAYVRPHTRRPPRR